MYLYAPPPNTSICPSSSPGKYKRTLDPVGPVTEEGVQKTQQELQAIHDVRSTTPCCGNAVLKVPVEISSFLPATAPANTQVFKKFVLLSRPHLQARQEEVFTGTAPSCAYACA